MGKEKSAKGTEIKYTEAQIKKYFGKKPPKEFLNPVFVPREKSTDIEVYTYPKMVDTSNILIMRIKNTVTEEERKSCSLKAKYKQVKTTKKITMEGSNGIMVPVATLKSGYGGCCQIIKDGDSYEVVLKQQNGKYKAVTHIFPEAFNVLKTLPTPK